MSKTDLPPSEHYPAINLIAPYILTALIWKPQRLIYLSSMMHMQDHADLKRLAKNNISYCDSKLYLLMLSNFVAKHWHAVYSNAVDAGWAPTNMGGKSAPDCQSTISGLFLTCH